MWFVNADGASTRTRLDDRDLVDNAPSTLTLIAPALAPGGYFVEVVTQSSTNNKTLLKEPRTYK